VGGGRNIPFDVAKTEGRQGPGGNLEGDNPATKTSTSSDKSGVGNDQTARTCCVTNRRIIEGGKGGEEGSR